MNRAWTRVVARKLRRRWSPEQIAGWLKRTYPDDENYQVSHETIYRSLFIQARGALKKELLQYLRTQRSMRQSRHKSLKGEGKCQPVQLDAVARQLNERPRKTLDYETLAERFNQCVASIG